MFALLCAGSDIRAGDDKGSGLGADGDLDHWNSSMGDSFAVAARNGVAGIASLWLTDLHALQRAIVRTLEATKNNRSIAEVLGEVTR